MRLLDDCRHVLAGIERVSPRTPGEVGDRQQRLPDVLLAVAQFVREIGAGERELVDEIACQRPQRLEQRGGLLVGLAAAEPLHLLAARLGLQRDRDAAALERVAERSAVLTGEELRAVDGNLLASMRAPSPTMRIA